jgi:hypothetical protein
VIATAVMSAKATEKAIRLREKQREDLTKLEQVKLLTPVYIPTIVMGSLTISCIFGANVLNKRQQASLMSAYGLLDQSFKDYRKKLIELHGEEADREVRDALVREHCDFHYIGVDSPDAKLVWYDEISGRTFEAYEREVMDAEYHINRIFAMRGYVCLNEFYEFLGLDMTDYGDTVGWDCCDMFEEYEFAWIDFEHRLITLDDGREVYAITMLYPPCPDYDD